MVASHVSYRKPSHERGDKPVTVDRFRQRECKDRKAHNRQALKRVAYPAPVCATFDEPGAGEADASTYEQPEADLLQCELYPETGGLQFFLLRLRRLRRIL